MQKLFRGVIAVGAMWACTAQASTYYFKPVNPAPSSPKQDASGKSGITDAEWFQTPDFSDTPVKATAGNDYVVTNFTMRTPSGSDAEVAFAGDSLQIGIVGGASGTVAFSGSNNGTGGLTTPGVRYNKLKLAKGIYGSWRSGLGPVYGPVEVLSPSTKRFVINYTASAYGTSGFGHYFYGPFTGAKGTGLSLQSAKGYGFRVVFAGDMSEYYGDIQLYNNSNTGEGTNVTLCATSGAKTLNNVTMQTGTSLRAWTADDAFTIGKLTVSDSNCRLVVPVDFSAGKAGNISVSSLSGVSEDQPLTVVLASSGTLTGEALTLPVLEFTDTSITTNCFVLPVAVSMIKYFDLPHISWDIRDKEGSEGVRQLVLITKPVAFQKTTDPVNYSGQPANSSLTNETAWTIDGVPHAGVDYVSACANIVSSYSNKKAETLTFEGDSLTLSNCCFYIYCYNFESKGSIVFLPKSAFVFHVAGGGLRTLTAPEVRIPGSLSDDSVVLQCYQNSIGLLNAPITGTGTINVQGRSGSSNPMGGLILAGDNSKFGGRFYVYVGRCTRMDSKTKITTFLGPDIDRYVWLQVSEANQLGGPVPGYTETAPYFKALELSNYSGLMTTNDITLAESTRGVYIKTYARFIVSNSTLRLNQQLTLNGTCRVQGGGTLALGGAIKFTDKATDTPVALSNVIAVVEGGLEFAGENAVNGAAISFAAGTKLAVRPGMASTGALLTKELSDVTLPDGVESMPCEIDVNGIEEPNGTQFVVPLWTVNSSLAPTMRKFTVKKPWKGWRVSIRETTNEDGSITFTADCTHVGMVMYVQ